MDRITVTRRQWIGITAGTVAAAAMTGATNGTPGPAARPNILLLMTDQHRGDCLGANGNPAIITPHLDRIAREGACFRRAYSCVPSCTPARASLLTGLGPWRNGMLGYSRIPERYPREMPRMLSEAGYHASVVGKCHFHSQRNSHGFDQMILDESGRRQHPEFKSDYHAWFDTVAPNHDPNATGVGWNDYLARPYALPEELHPTRWTGDVAVNFIESYDKEQPFFFKVSFARPHSPYDAPQRFFDLYRDADIPERFLGDWSDRYARRSWEKDDIWHGDMGADATRHSRMGYYGNVTFIDEQVGRILAALEKRQLLENTLIFFLSDHGDMLGDHHLWRKTYAFEGSARIPFLVRWPDNLMNARRGQVREEPVELRDVLPTFLDAASLPGGEDMDGASLLPLIAGTNSAWRSCIDLEHDVCYDRANHWNALTDGRMKYVFHAMDGEEMLFDLDADPGETRNLAARSDHRETLESWRQRMVAHLGERGEDWVKDGQLQRRPQSILYSPHYPESGDSV